MAMLRARIRSLAHGLGRRRSVERDLDAELRAHLDARAEDLVQRRGLSLEEARRQARLEFGAMEKYKEESRDARGLRWIDALRGDLRYAFRQIRRQPGFSTAAILTIALGIGPNATMMTIVASVFRPLPVPQPGQMTVFATTLPGNPRIWQRVAYLDYLDYQSQVNTFAGLAAWDLSFVGLTADGQTDRLIGTVVSGNYFSTLGLVPAAGRLLAPSDGELGGVEPVAVISYAYWMRRFGGDPSVAGREARVNGRPYTIIGVAPERFAGTLTLINSDVYLPLQLFRSETRFANRDVLSVRVIGRMHPGVTLDQARASVDAATAMLAREYPATNAGRRVHVYAERMARPEPQTASQAPMLAAFFLALVGAVLLIACANVLGLFLARGLGRGREMALRTTLGGTKWHLVRLCLVETFVIALGGALLGTTFGMLLARAAESASSPGIPLALAFRMDWTTFGYVAILLAVSTMVIGLLPALRASRAAPAMDLAGIRVSTAGHQRQVIRRGLAVAQLAGSVALLLVCGLFIRSVQHLHVADLGLDAERVLLASADPFAVGYDAARARAFFESVDGALEAVPGVASAATATFVPFGSGNSTSYVGTEDSPQPSSAAGTLAENNFVSADYFDTVGTPLERGRTFGSVDATEASPVAVVNRALAARLWPDQDAVGKRFRTSTQRATLFTVIGVVDNATYRRDEIGVAHVPRFFLSFDQVRQAGARTLHIRAQDGVPPETLAATIEASVRRIDAAVPVFDVHTLNHQIGYSSGGFGGARGAAMVTGMLGLLALVLALVGTYGVMSFSVRERTREIGIRLALGLQPARAFQMLFNETWLIAALGLIGGVALGVAAGRFAGGFLFGVAPHDQVTILTVVAAIALVSALVGFFPARRASKVDPAKTLRYE
jgi:predicted permease